MGSPLRIVVIGELPPEILEALEALPGGAEIRVASDPASAVEGLRGVPFAVGVGSLSAGADAVFLAAADREIARASRYRHPLALAIVAPDGLEELERAFGGRSGAELLGGCEEALRRSLRKMDMLFRLDGGEFAALLPETPRDGALAVADRLRRVAGRVLVKPGGGGARPGLPLRTTASVGLTSLSPNAVVTAAELLREARESLNSARADGGDRVGTEAGRRG